MVDEYVFVQGVGGCDGGFNASGSKLQPLEEHLNVKRHACECCVHAAL